MYLLKRLVKTNAATATSPETGPPASAPNLAALRGLTQRLTKCSKPKTSIPAEDRQLPVQRTCISEPFLVWRPTIVGDSAQTPVAALVRSVAVHKASYVSVILCETDEGVVKTPLSVCE
ncbi:hypothetical protein TGRH88_009500 [Toxoplasma gondii]|uniref:Uncharacterized protein n=1 Tax=Toxoplasma gondii TaxID=5811 RepID=A0A7J6KCI2_TOXGO|nr:hypothetical protein TGRH88_009500 [Toxoplasma gondii]